QLRGRAGVTQRGDRAGPVVVHAEAAQKKAPVVGVQPAHAVGDHLDRLGERSDRWVVPRCGRPGGGVVRQRETAPDGAVPLLDARPAEPVSARRCVEGPPPGPQPAGSAVEVAEPPGGLLVNGGGGHGVDGPSTWVAVKGTTTAG